MYFLKSCILCVHVILISVIFVLANSDEHLKMAFYLEFIICLFSHLFPMLHASALDNRYWMFKLWLKIK
jgi:hypothetical protein